MAASTSRRSSLRSPSHAGSPSASTSVMPATVTHPHAPTRSSSLRNSLLPPNSPQAPAPAPSEPATSPVFPLTSSSPRHTTRQSPTKASHNLTESTLRRVPLQLPAAEPDLLCAFCGGPEGKNQHNRREEMVSCFECGSSGHPTCLLWEDMRLVKKAKSYPWLCQDCKRCEVCDSKGESHEEDDMLLCDSCDRGWHRACLDPPMTTIPRSKWNCPTCAGEANFFAPVDLSLPRKRIIPPPPAPPPPAAPTPSSSSNRSHKRKALSDGAEEASSDDDDADLEWLKNYPTSITTTNNRKEKGKEKEQHQATTTDEERPRIKVPSAAPSGGGLKLTFKMGESSTSTPTPRIRVRPPKKKKKEEIQYEPSEPEEEENDDEENEGEAEEEDDDPYGGILTEEQAEVGDRKPDREDRAKWGKAKEDADAKALQDFANSSLYADPSTPVASGSAMPSQAFDAASLSQSLRAHRNPLAATIATSTPSRIPATPAVSNPPTPGGSMILGLPVGPTPIKAIRFGEFEIETWYQAPFPEEFSRTPEGKLWYCEFCLKYMKSEWVWERHMLKCKTRHPPGDEIYRDGKVSVFEVDGRKNKIYCQNLCLLAKMFLDHKTLYYDVEPFLFYVMTTSEITGAKFVGYFSKEKRSPTNNVSCIMTLPVRQRKGWGGLLIDFSYLLSKKEVRLGTPERPLSELGLLSYRQYWTLIVFQYLVNVAEPDKLTFEEISAKTSMMHEDIFFVLQEQNMITDLEALPPAASALIDGLSPMDALVPKSSFRGNQWSSRKRPNKVATATLAGSSSRQPHAEDPHAAPPVMLPVKYKIHFDREVVAAYVDKWEKKEYLTLKPEKLQWSPFLVTRGYGLDVPVGSTAKVPTNGTGPVANGFVGYVGNAIAAPRPDRSSNEDTPLTGTAATSEAGMDDTPRVSPSLGEQDGATSEADGPEPGPGPSTLANMAASQRQQSANGQNTKSPERRSRLNGSSRIVPDDEEEDLADGGSDVSFHEPDPEEESDYDGNEATELREPYSRSRKRRNSFSSDEEPEEERPSRRSTRVRTSSVKNTRESGPRRLTRGSLANGTPRRMVEDSSSSASPPPSSRRSTRSRLPPKSSTRTNGIEPSPELGVDMTTLTEANGIRTNGHQASLEPEKVILETDDEDAEGEDVDAEGEEVDEEE